MHSHYFPKEECSLGFTGQIRKFDTQIYLNFIQIRQTLSCRESYDSNSLSYHSI